MPAQTRIQLRRGTAAAGPNQWTNQVLYAGEIGYETDTGKFKIGDDLTSWDSLPYSNVLPSEFNEMVDDRVAALLVAGDNISLNYNDAANTLTISSSASSNLTPGDVEEIIGTKILPGSGISVDYDIPTGTTTISLSDPIINVEDIFNFDIIVDEKIDDRVNNLLQAGDGIGLSYNDQDNELEIRVTGINLSKINNISATETEINFLQGVVPGSSLPSSVLVTDSDNSIQNINNISTSGNINIGGDLIVGGSSVTVNTETVTIEDPILTLGGTGTLTVNDNKDRGIEFKYFTDSPKTGFFGYDNNTDTFIFLTNATNNNEIFSGDRGTIDANLSWSSITNKPDLELYVNLTGDVAGSGNVTLTDLQNGGINITTAVQPSSVILGTDTVGTYVSKFMTLGTGISVDSPIGSVVLSSNATSNKVPDTIVARDNNSNFSANMIYGLSAISGTSMASATYLYNVVIDGGTP